MNVSLPDELAAYVEAKISTGHYGSSSEVVREALRLMANADDEQGDLARLREACAAGKASGIYGQIDFKALRIEARERLAAAKRTAERAG